MTVKSILLQLALATVLNAQTDWPVYGHDDGGMRYSTLKQINGSNVSRLQRAWTYHTNSGAYHTNSVRTATVREPVGQVPLSSESTNRLPNGRGSTGSTTAFETTPLVIGN